MVFVLSVGVHYGFSLSENLKSLDMLAQSLSLDEDISRAILLLCRDCIYFLMLREKFETLSAKFTESASNLGEEAILMEYAQFGWLFITHCKNYFSQVSGSGDRAVTLFVAAFALAGGFAGNSTAAYAAWPLWRAG